MFLRTITVLSVVILAYTFENEENNNSSSITKTSSSESTEQRETMSSSVPSSQSNQTVTTSQSTPFTALPVGDSSTTLAHSSPISTYNVNTSLSEMAVITDSVTTEDIPSQNHASVTSEHSNLEITTDKPESVASEVNYNEVPTASNEAANSSILDVTTCKSSIDDALLPMVLIGGNDGLYWAKLAEERLPVLVYRQGLNAYSVDYHYKYNFVFFTAGGNLIIRMRNNNIFPAGDVKEILRNVTGHVEIAVDWVQDHIYWLSGALKTIERANLDGENRTIIYQNRSEISENPRSLVIDPYERFLFIVDSDNAYRFNLSNNQLETIIKSSIDNETTFTCLALNRHKKRLYFSGEEKDGRPYVASSSYDGKDIVPHDVGGHWNFIFSIDIFRDTLFFANYEENMADSLYRKQLTSNCTAEKIFIPPKPGNDIGPIRMYHPNIQSPEDFRTRLEVDDEML